MSTPLIHVQMEDPSEFTPEHKDKSEFRDFRMHNVPERVKRVYSEMHRKQTYAFVNQKMSEWCRFDHAEITVMEALEILSSYLDESDPDVDMPNSIHAFQTAEGIREANPDKEWLQVTGLIHDIGKLMAVWGEPQWCVVGDTLPVGCAPSKRIVFDAQYFAENPDMDDPTLNTRLGVYTENCGLENVLMSWGHDEYLYRVLNANTCHLPDEALYAIRFHSFYPWHTSEDYMFLCNNKDLEMLQWVREFNKFDLYTKCPDTPDIEQLKRYYGNLVEKYVPGKLKW
ncbi:inositol oxygenase-like [Dreissena polymorpha]|uniref:inositol oxygenase-like n=1 Tax=Dreissena polymorpha TaxID=45954 RepID=UPI002264B7A7|nr:inositol oxygenase-like [Dreissena polymorpha]XP_052232581.1 inositol oxygenase-like [Dreissena polymorpha]